MLYIYTRKKALEDKYEAAGLEHRVEFDCPEIPHPYPVLEAVGFTSG